MRRSEGETGSIGVGFRALFSPDDAGNEKGRLKDGPNVVTEVLLLLNDLDDTACSRLDQNRAAIDHRVSVLAYAILRRHVVVGHAFFRQNGTNSQVFPILIRRTPLFDHIGTEAGTLIYPEDAGYAAELLAALAQEQATDGVAGFIFGRLHAFEQAIAHGALDEFSDVWDRVEDGDLVAALER